MSLEQKITKFDFFLLKYSRTIDTVDLFLGPVTELSKFSDSDVVKNIGILSSIVKGVIKVPFVTLYLCKTKDYQALYDWIPKEVFSYFVPMGSFIDILRSYEKVTFKQYGLVPFTNLSNVNVSK